MAMIGAAFGLGFTFGPLFGYLAVPSGQGDPGPGPGYAAAALSAFALALAAIRNRRALRRRDQSSCSNISKSTFFKCPADLGISGVFG